jgi:hypothetical protein
MTLDEAIAQFTKDHKELEDPYKAWLRCDCTSYEFIKFVDEHVPDHGCKVYGFYTNDPIMNPDRILFRVKQHDATGWHTCCWHMIVETPTAFIDWTSRQYASTTEYPHVILKKTMAASGG